MPGWDAKDGEITTKSSRERRVPVAGALRPYLAEHLLGLGRHEGLVFGASATHPFCERSDRLWKEAKLARVALHECRHTYASLMIGAGVNAKALSEYMGHAKIAITMIYTGT